MIERFQGGAGKAPLVDELAWQTLLTGPPELASEAADAGGLVEFTADIRGMA